MILNNDCIIKYNMIKDKKIFGDFNLYGLNLKLKYIKNEFNYHYNIKELFQ